MNIIVYVKNVANGVRHIKLHIDKETQHTGGKKVEL